MPEVERKKREPLSREETKADSIWRLRGDLAELQRKVAAEAAKAAFEDAWVEFRANRVLGLDDLPFAEERIALEAAERCLERQIRRVNNLRAKTADADVFATLRAAERILGEGRRVLAACRIDAQVDEEL